MSGETLNDTVDTLATTAAPGKESVEGALGTALRQTKDNPYWTFYEFELAGGSLSGGEFRHSKNGNGALLILNARNGDVAEADLNLKARGPVQNIDINPRIPPEGTDTYAYDVNGVRISYQFTHTSRKLRSLVLEWVTKSA